MSKFKRKNQSLVKIEKLDSIGSETIAEAYLNCGNKELSRAAIAWASKHNYKVNNDASGANRVNWGG